MRRREFLVQSSRAVLGASLLPTSGRADWGTLTADLEKLIPKLMEESLLPGLSIAIIKDGKLFWRRGFGIRDKASNAPVNNDTVFGAESMSKPVFAYAALKLCDRGVIGLDVPLTKYTPQRVLEGDPRLDLITARHVLSHASGFQNWRSETEPLKIHFAPGERYQYSGEGYSYLQSVVTHLTGRSDVKNCGRYEAGLEVCATDIERYMKANVFVPFGMTSSGYVWNEVFERRVARPHDGEGKRLNQGKPTVTDAARYAAAGALLTTPTDYARFIIEVIDPKGSDAFRLKKDTLAEMLRPHVKARGLYPSSWALGWQIFHGQKRDLIAHGGNNTGAHCFAVASVERKSGYVIMTNGDSGVAVLAKLMAMMNPYLDD